MANFPWNCQLRVMKKRMCLSFIRRLYMSSRPVTENCQYENEESTSKSSIKMIPAWMRAHLFGSDAKRGISEKKFHLNTDGCSKISSQSGKHSEWEDAEFDLPDLKGKSLQAHFRAIGESQSSVYLALLENLMKKIPQPPHEWVFQPGWTRYTCSSKPESVLFPEDDALILDVEVCVPEGSTPSLATAVSTDAWYCWVSPNVIRGSAHNHNFCTVNDMIPLGSTDSRPRIIVGHNVSYDKARLRDAYSLELSGLRYFDTMSAHICICGVTSLQRFYMVNAKDAKSRWMQLTSSYSLSQLHKFYCGQSLDKTSKSHFVTGSNLDIKEHFQELVNYCASDVVATHSVFEKMLPVYTRRFPHPVSLAGMLELSAVYLPVNSKWPQKFKTIEEDVLKNEDEVKELLQQIAGEACELLHDNMYLQDPWMWDQDWSVKHRKKKVESGEFKPVKGDFEHDFPSPPRVSNTGRPFWYRNIGHQKDSFGNRHLNITAAMLITPKLLQLCWGSYPLHYIRGYGWGILVPKSASYEKHQINEKGIPVDSLRKLCSVALPEIDSEVSSEEMFDFQENIEHSISNITDKPTERSKYEFEIKLGEGVVFRKLPHNRGFDYSVGSPLSKDLIMNPALCSRNEKGQRVLSLLRRNLFWKKFQEKLQFVPLVWHDASCQYGAFVPPTVVCGDFKRHPTEELFSKLLENKSMLGSELLETFEAPSKWIFLSTHIPEADMWVASSLADGIFGVYGSSQLGRLFLEKQLFSHVAYLMDMKESQARLLCYAILFGAQKRFLSQMISKSDMTLSRSESVYLADEFFGNVVGRLLPGVKPLYETSWTSGVMSELWNKLQETVLNSQVQTPFLNSHVSQALESEPKKFLPLLMTWIVQSCKVDFLHLLLVCFHDLEPNARLCLRTSNDTLSFLVPLDRQYLAAKSLHFSHLMARAFCASQIGFTDLPLSTAFLPSVQLSKSILPEVSRDCENLSILEAVKLSSDFDLKGKKQVVVKGRKQSHSSCCKD